MKPIISTENLTHVYSMGTPFEHTAIRDVCFEAHAGEYLCVIGHTGSGKSTFIQHLNGLLKPTSGVVRFEGEDIHKSKAFTRDVRFRVGLVFQYPEYQLFEETCYKDIAFGPKNMGLSESEIDEHVRLGARFAGVDESLFSLSPLELSGGQKRRIAIAGVMAMEPDVLVLDEPIAGLDPAGCRALLNNIKEYHRSTHGTVILVTHDMDVAASEAQRLVVMNKGAIALDGTPAEIFSRPTELRSMGLDIPDATALAQALRERGVEIPESIYTPRFLAGVLLSRNGEGPC